MNPVASRGLAAVGLERSRVVNAEVSASTHLRMGYWADYCLDVQRLHRGDETPDGSLTSRQYHHIGHYFGSLAPSGVAHLVATHAMLIPCPAAGSGVGSQSVDTETHVLGVRLLIDGKYGAVTGLHTEVRGCAIQCSRVAVHAIVADKGTPLRPVLLPVTGQEGNGGKCHCHRPLSYRKSPTRRNHVAKVQKVVRNTKEFSFF